VSDVFQKTLDAGLMCPRPMCPRSTILGCCAPGTKLPLDIVSLTDVSRPWTAPYMQLAPSAAIAASVGLRRLMDQWGVWPASPTPLTRFIGLAPLRRMHARPTHKIKSKGWDGSVRGKIAKGHFVQGMQHPRILGRGHIGRGWTNIAPNMNPPPPIQLASKFSPQFSKGRTHSPGGKGGGGLMFFGRRQTHLCILRIIIKY